MPSLKETDNNKVIEKREMSKHSNLLTFLRNLKYLYTHSITDEMRKRSYEEIFYVKDAINYGCLLDKHLLNIAPPFRIFDDNATVELLLSNPKSFCRFGDGEINIIQGKSIPFQEYDAQLAEKLIFILQHDIPDFYVGLGREYFYFDVNERKDDYVNRFYLIEGASIRRFLLNNCVSERAYISTGFNQCYYKLDSEQQVEYYSRIECLFKNKIIAVFIGEGTKLKLQYDVFHLAASVSYEIGPSINAFSAYDEIYNRALMYSKTTLLCFALGPASKALSYDLHIQGYMAWDIGHMPKDYDAYMKGKGRKESDLQEFYAPDV